MAGAAPAPAAVSGRPSASSSGESAWATSTRRSRIARSDHTHTMPSSPPDAKRDPSAEGARARRPPVCACVRRSSCAPPHNCSSPSRQPLTARPPRSTARTRSRPAGAPWRPKLASSPLSDGGVRMSGWRRPTASNRSAAGASPGCHASARKGPPTPTPTTATQRLDRHSQRATVCSSTARAAAECAAGDALGSSCAAAPPRRALSTARRLPRGQKASEQTAADGSSTMASHVAESQTAIASPRPSPPLVDAAAADATSRRSGWSASVRTAAAWPQ